MKLVINKEGEILMKGFYKLSPEERKKICYDISVYVNKEWAIADLQIGINFDIVSHVFNGGK